MPKLTFYKQARVDGGIRTGIDIDGTTVFGRFARGGEESDPALSWYVDVRAEGRSLPDSPEEARHWFLEQAPVIKSGLIELADKLESGVDIESWPIAWPLVRGPKGARINIVVSAMRRPEALAIAAVLKDLASEWEKTLQKLRAVRPVSR